MTTKPVLILQNLNTDGPAYLASWLAARGIPFEVRNSHAGDEFPVQAAGWRAVAVLGGEMSANDPLLSLRRAEALIRDAAAGGVPVLGHCLGGQLMARALGAAVGASPAPEIGWQALEVLDDPVAQRWLGSPGAREVMQWHYEAFDLPPGARLLARSAACPHQAFALGPHLAMQFHIEVDLAKVHAWVGAHDPRWHDVQGGHPSVQRRQDILDGAHQLLVEHQRMADRIFETWLSASA